MGVRWGGGHIRPGSVPTLPALTSCLLYTPILSGILPSCGHVRNYQCSAGLAGYLVTFLHTHLPDLSGTHEAQ